MRTTRPLATALLLLALPAQGLAAQFDPNLHTDPSVGDCSVRFAPNLTQDAFRRFVREFGSVSAFKQVSPPTTLGQWRFAVDAEGLAFRWRSTPLPGTTPSSTRTDTTRSARTSSSRW
jgi:hypothetical protein